MEKKLLEINWNLLKVFSWFSNNLKCGEFSHLLCNLFRWTTCISKHFCLKLKHMETSFSPKKFGAITSTFCNVYAAWLFIFFCFIQWKNFLQTLTHERLRQQKKKYIKFHDVVGYHCMSDDDDQTCSNRRRERDWRMTSSALHGCRFT